MAKVEKLLKRFRMVFEDQNFYEAHQVARTIYYRWLELNEYEKLTGFLSEKILEFAKVNEPTITFDLGDLYAKTLVQSAAPVNDSILDQIEKLVEALSKLEVRVTDQKSSPNPLIPIVTQLINWSTESSSASLIEHQYGNARLNLIFAKVFEAKNQFELAKKHYICSKDPQAYAQFIIKNFNHLTGSDEEKEAPESSHHLEEDSFITLTVLQVLSIGRVGVATKLLHLLVEKHNKYSARPPFASALLNFTWLLTFSVQLRSIEYFTELVETYKPTLTRDSRILYHVDKIGQKFFGVPEKEQGFGGGILGSLLKGMSTKKEVKLENPMDFKPDDVEFLTEYKITDQGFHSTWDAASGRNPPGSCTEPHFSDALEEQHAHAPSSHKIQRSKRHGSRLIWL
ncbi:Golgi to ER traffic protein 4-like protein [Aphelenchoides bicaudatus]|nr:Golgi to ER traffic protein 4-like protein [Aphelenchoides bicaudatus]